MPAGLPLLDVLALTAGLLALALAGVALVRLRALRAECAACAGAAAAAGATATEVGRMPASIGVGSGLQRHAVVRYDAFPDSSGRLSFSLALLDDAGDGVVLSSIHARNETRTYAKGVRSGLGAQALSPEEEQAIRLAWGRPPVPASVPA